MLSRKNDILKLPCTLQQEVSKAEEATVGSTTGLKYGWPAATGCPPLLGTSSKSPMPANISTSKGDGTLNAVNSMVIEVIRPWRRRPEIKGSHLDGPASDTRRIPRSSIHQ
ncbi:hypothetical protein D5086_011762 [Populus alba]|uniref:Uncharacterized protein n=1 Tax=Populus alba TaxID=43335 RepID=A0ACC4CD51_POPAL